MWPFILQCDQPKEGIVNNSSKMDEFCKENQFVTWFETSAKDNINIDEATNCLVAKVYNFCFELRWWAGMLIFMTSF